MQIYRKFKPAVAGNEQFNDVYQQILIPGVKALTKMERNGGPIDTQYLIELDRKYTAEVEALTLEIKQYPAVKQFELDNSKDFNPGSVKQLGELLLSKITSSKTY